MIDKTKLEKFHTYVGEVIMCCQCIEYDIKMIYAGMRRGDYEDNMYMVRKDPLGVVVNNLERMDSRDDKAYFTKDDYKYMRKITKIRNYWVHDSYVSFVYNDDDEYFNNIYNRLIEDRTRLSHFSKSVEDKRIAVLKAFGRM